MSDEVAEPFGVEEIFFDGIENIYILGGMFRCTMYVWRRDSGRDPIKIAVKHIAIPMSEVSAVIEAAMAVLGNQLQNKILDAIRAKILH